jgi:NitT/TauT family transport system substrate-binding protein
MFGIPVLQATGVGRARAVEVGTLLGLVVLSGCGPATSPAANVPASAANAVSGASGAAAPAAQRPAVEPQKVSVRLDWIPHAAQAPLHLAMDRGWFTERGLDVDLQDGNGSVVTVQTVGAGKFDIGHANLASMAIGREEGLPVRSVAGIIRKSDMGVLFSEGAPYRTPRDFEGKQVIYTSGSLETPFLDAFFRNGGTSSDRVNLVSVDAAAKVSTYASGRGDAVISTVPYVYAITKQARSSSWMLFDDYSLPLPGFGLFTTEEVIKSRPEMVRAFVETAVRAWEYTRGHPEEAADAMIAQRPQASLNRDVEVLGLEVFRSFVDTERTRGKAIGWQSEDDWADTVRALREAGVIKEGGRPADFFTNDFVPNG